MTIGDLTICWDARTGADQNDIIAFEVRDGNGFRHISIVETLCRIRHQFGEFIKRARGLPYGTHFQPMTEKHNVNQCDQFPEESFTEVDELRSDTIDERNRDGE